MVVLKIYKSLSYSIFVYAVCLTICIVYEFPIEMWLCFERKMPLSSVIQHRNVERCFQINALISPPKERVL